MKPRTFSIETRARVVELYRSGCTYEEIADKQITYYDVTKILREEMDVAERRELGRQHKLRQRKVHSVGDVNKMLTKKWI